MNDSYRKKFPKGKDWKAPKENPYGFCGLNEDSYHGMKVIGVTQEKYEELQERIKELETQLYFCHRNNKIEKDVNGKISSKFNDKSNVFRTNTRYIR